MDAFNYGDEYLAFLGVNNCDSGGIDIVLAHSRDGRQYELPLGYDRFLVPGEAGTWNGELLNVPLSPPLRRGQRLYVHYTARNSTQYATGLADNYLGVASLGVDRFVGMSAGAEGFILTEPVPVNAPELVVNVQNTYGYVQVEVRDENNKAIPGYEMDACPRMHERSTSARVQWRDRTDLRELLGKRCSLKIAINNATIYSYRFGGA